MEMISFVSEILKLISYLSLVILGVLLIVFYCSDLKSRRDAKERLKNLPEEVAEILLSKADDERPIMLNVSQERLIDKTVEEIEKRQRLGGFSDGKNR